MKCGVHNIEDGIDAAWFINDAYKHKNIQELKDYQAVNFDNKVNRSLLAELNSKGQRVINTHHSVFHRPRWQRQSKNSFFSYSYKDFLNIYGNVKNVCTDRIHSAIASIAFDTDVSLYTKSDRVEMFRRVGCELQKESLKKITVNMKMLKNAKQEQLETLRKVIKNGT